jgi:hypothetical protein
LKLTASSGKRSGLPSPGMTPSTEKASFQAAVGNVLLFIGKASCLISVGTFLI